MSSTWKHIFRNGYLDNDIFVPGNVSSGLFWSISTTPSFFTCFLKSLSPPTNSFNPHHQHTIAATSISLPFLLFFPPPPHQPASKNRGQAYIHHPNSQLSRWQSTDQTRPEHAIPYRNTMPHPRYYTIKYSTIHGGQPRSGAYPPASTYMNVASIGFSIYCHALHYRISAMSG